MEVAAGGEVANEEAPGLTSSCWLSRATSRTSAGRGFFLSVNNRSSNAVGRRPRCAPPAPARPRPGTRRRPAAAFATRHRASDRRRRAPPPAPGARTHQQGAPPDMRRRSPSTSLGRLMRWTLSTRSAASRLPTCSAGRVATIYRSTLSRTGIAMRLSAATITSTSWPSSIAVAAPLPAGRARRRSSCRRAAGLRRRSPWFCSSAQVEVGIAARCLRASSMVMVMGE